jgi:hypothetical protein
MPRANPSSVVKHLRLQQPSDHIAQGGTAYRCLIIALRTTPLLTVPYPGKPLQTAPNQSSPCFSPTVYPRLCRTNLTVARLTQPWLYAPDHTEPCLAFLPLFLPAHSEPSQPRSYQSCAIHSIPRFSPIHYLVPHLTQTHPDQPDLTNPDQAEPCFSPLSLPTALQVRPHLCSPNRTSPILTIPHHCLLFSRTFYPRRTATLRTSPQHCPPIPTPP